MDIASILNHTTTPVSAVESFKISRSKSILGKDPAAIAFVVLASAFQKTDADYNKQSGSPSVFENISTNEDIQINLFNYLFTTVDTLTQKNKHLFILFDELIRAEKFALVDAIINDNAIRDWDISLLKSAQIMTESLKGKCIDNSKLLAVLASKLKK